ncbi:MAG: hypothetical protein BWX61_01013 [Bacteroidetes bacterium ADurb.Bin035]|nr:MAG: hypothetical protein BWX61_01013 [Bacteroidetes bacterium ADurb.Bin035]
MFCKEDPHKIGVNLRDRVPFLRFFNISSLVIELGSLKNFDIISSSNSEIVSNKLDRYSSASDFRFSGISL